LKTIEGIQTMAKAAANKVPNKAPPGSAQPAAATADKSRTMQVFVKPGETHDRAVAGMVARGLVTNASTVIRFESHEFEGLSLMEMARELRSQGESVNSGDLSTLERTLTAQALSLNAIFGELARIAHCNLFKVPDVAERYLRLALKAQGQSRATVETLATIKNPPVVFARQANINNGGQQQVNNGAANPLNRDDSAPSSGDDSNAQSTACSKELTRRSKVEEFPSESPEAQGANLQPVPVGERS
jgi:hypothetical protein